MLWALGSGQIIKAWASPGRSRSSEKIHRVLDEAGTEYRVNVALERLPVPVGTRRCAWAGVRGVGRVLWERWRGRERVSSGSPRTRGWEQARAAGVGGR